MSEKVLVSYATMMGATASIAGAIGARLRAAGLEADVREIGAVQAVTPYDAVLFGSAIYEGRWRPEAVRFLRQHEAQLRSRPVWLFQSGPVGVDRYEAQPVPPDVAQLVELVHAPPVKTFAGDLQDDAVARHQELEGLAEDDRDWEEIRDWADEIAGKLHDTRQPT
ncbi:flavodoxin domain-containing protein [Kribbella sp. NPDC004875]|uniref:flavodoxin domain-containing protein n=1 Tax=Kribbella sp. NPDC004875 TaxID=3364107 RepID=UPI0036B78190